MDLIETQGTKDARGRVLQEGDEIILVSTAPIFFRILSIDPMLDPQAPPNALKIVAAAVIPFGALRGNINHEFIRVRTVEEAGPVPYVVRFDTVQKAGE